MKIRKLIVSIMLSAIIIETPAFAADIDLSSLSVEDLIDLKDQIDDEIYEKQGFIDLPYGYYIVGKDIAAGEYTIKPYGEGADNTDYSWKIRIFISEDLRKAYDVADEEFTLKKVEAWKNQEAGFEMKAPDPINIYDYVTINEYIDFPREYTFSLEEGNVLYIDEDYILGDTKLVISKGTKKGLFMD